ncbi:MAG TPA: TIGR01777 family oxidoreductase [Thermoanaerobaculia bacterium]|nr:TIGR01777 family oxidoreductase [Thermoanaerobaculia bacterium]
MKTVIAGASGFVGQALVPALSGRGEVVALSRGDTDVPGARTVRWDPSVSGVWQDEVASSDVVINLAGASIGAGRWTPKRKAKLVSSRLDSTAAIVDVLKKNIRSDRTLINASAVGYYGSRGDEVLTEKSAAGNDFLADLCKRWEAAALAAEGSARVVISRLGVVLGPGGGALPQMLLPFKFFVGGPIGRGNQWMSWIDRRDLTAIVLWLLDHKSARGVYNAASPEPVTNRAFAKTAGSVMSRPSIFPAPPLALRLGLGEMADALLLSSQRAVPHRLLEGGFEFRHAELDQTLAFSVR